MPTVKFMLEFPISKIKEPVFTKLVTDFDVNPNVLAANVDASKGGWLQLGMDGSNEQIAKAKQWILETGIKITEE